MAQIGDLLGGKYTLEARLGAGAMGEVWKATHRDLGRAVAIKILRREHTEDPHVVTRFLREARAANLVRHTNVVDVLDVGQDDAGTPFLVEELLEGQDLGARLSELGHGLPVDEALRILVPVVEAVAFAHGRGVVHRDIKPENVFLCRVAGAVVPKLLDFGISHIDAEGAARMTATGMSLGTPAYMAPEQIKSARNVDARSDVWSLGILIHEMLSGELPFKGETVADHFVQIATGDPKPLELALPHAPRAIARVVARCLKRSPADRYQDAGTLLFDLEAVAAESRPGKPQVTPHDGPDPGLELLPLAAPAPGAAPGRGPTLVARVYSLRPGLSEEAGRRVLVSLGVTVGALALAGALASFDLVPDDWALAAPVTAFFSGLSANAARGAGVIFAGLGVGAAMRGWREEPRSMAHFLAAATATAMTVAVLGASMGQWPWAVTPYAAAAGAVGAGAIAVRWATDAWMDDWRGNAVARAAAATAAFFVARLMMR
jgi:tRNA A-37 threonylcarbamoyl transferase component Bud32